MRELHLHSPRQKYTRFRTMLCSVAVLAALQLLASKASAQTCEQGTVSECHAEGMQQLGTKSYGRALALFVRGCQKGEVDACAALASLVLEHPEARAESPPISDLLTSECMRQNDAMCVQLSHDLVDDIGSLRRNKRARVALHAACERKIGAACTARGVIAQTRQRAGLRQARADYERGCGLGDGRGCRRLGELLEATEPVLAQGHYADGCQHEDAVSCGHQGRLLASTDAVAAEVLLARGCEAADVRSCAALGQLHQQGAFPGADAQVAERAFRTACAGGDSASCAQLGSILYRRGEGEGAEPFLRIACKGKQTQACTELGEVLTSRDQARLAKRFFAQARQANQGSCRRGHGAACLSVSEDYQKGRGVRASTAQAGRWLLQACLAGAGGRERCLEAGLAAAQPGSGQKVQPILGPLCDTGEVRACTALAPIMDISQRVPLYRRACELGDQRACAQVPGAVPATAAPVVAAVEAAATSETTQAPTSTETGAEETTQPSSAVIPAMSAQEAAEETAAQAEQARVQAEQAQRHAEAQQREAEQAAQAAQRREGQAQVRAAQAAAQEAIERKRADEATARETTAKEEALRASERESSAREEARQAGEREIAAQQRAREGEAAARLEAKQAALREAKAKNNSEKAAAREARARIRLEKVALQQARSRERAEKALASLALARTQAEQAAVSEAKARAEAQANAARAREALETAAQASEARVRAEKGEAEQRARAERLAEAKQMAEAREAAQRKRADQSAAREAELARLAQARESAREKAALAAENEAKAREQAEAKVAEAQRQAKEAEQREAEAQRQAQEAAAARAAAVTAAAREAELRRKAQAREEEQRRKAEEATARERTAREQATAREAKARQQAEAAAAREAEARQQAEAAAAREAEARRQAEARDAEERRNAEKVAAREAAARKAAEKVAVREAAARKAAEQAADREAALRKAAEAREQEQRLRAEALAAQAATARQEATLREQQLQAAIKEAEAREHKAERQREADEVARRQAAAQRMATQEEHNRQQAKAKQAALERASAERLRAAEERRDEQAQLKAARERTERKAREIRDTEVEQLALACEAGHVGSCEGAGLRLRDGLNTTADPQRALRLFERACLAGSTSGCTDAIPLLTPTTVAEQQRLLRLHEGACTNGPGHAVACQRAMDFLLTSDAEKAPPLVARLAQRTCALTPGRACVIAGDMAAEGRGMKVDRNKAVESFGRVCSDQGGAGCKGLATLCKQGWLRACERQAGELPEDEAPAHALLDQVAKLRRGGDDRGAAQLLEGALRDGTTARLQAELGLAYLGSTSFVGAERSLSAALEAEQDPWILAHREGLERVLRHARSRLGWIVLECTAAGERAHVVGAELACGRPFRIEIGEHMVELRAPKRRSIQRRATVQQGERVSVSATLEAHTCESAGMLHMGGEQGGCCWPGQSWTSGNSCSGTADSSIAISESRPQPRSKAATVQISLLGGATNFLGNSLFRSGVNAGSDSTVFGPRGEFRVGFGLGPVLTLQGIVGGSRQGFSYWGDCGAGAGDCVSNYPFTDTVDLGAMLQAHTNPRRSGGKVDFHLGIGVRPWSRIRLEDVNGGTAKLTSTVVPGELGASLFFGSTVSLDLLGQAELWLPWKYCDSECVGTDGVQTELAWSALAGLTFHIP